MIRFPITPTVRLELTMPREVPADDHAVLVAAARLVAREMLAEDGYHVARRPAAEGSKFDTLTITFLPDVDGDREIGGGHVQ